MKLISSNLLNLNESFDIEIPPKDVFQDIKSYITISPETPLFLSVKYGSPSKNISISKVTNIIEPITHKDFPSLNTLTKNVVLRYNPSTIGTQQIKMFEFNTNNISTGDKILYFRVIQGEIVKLKIDMNVWEDKMKSSWTNNGKTSVPIRPRQWFDNEQIAELNPGDYTIIAKDIDGYDTPTNKFITLEEGELIEESLTYTKIEDDPIEDDPIEDPIKPPSYDFLNKSVNWVGIGSGSFGGQSPFGPGLQFNASFNDLTFRCSYSGNSLTMSVIFKGYKCKFYFTKSGKTFVFNKWTIDGKKQDQGGFGNITY